MLSLATEVPTSKGSERALSVQVKSFGQLESSAKTFVSPDAEILVSLG